ncbi:thiamine pyrophosphate-requiring protein [Pseudomonas kuykendallii]|uniref:Pyruvate dehydrogenase (Quinone) n=1 Tax=Pseudomonas kuykendallii TaxID=1007099 RepID=A0A1H2QV85_9PSED|nr:thiamine pyrophosphate-requiring protein [Pseudomonas kuykendallii]MCQ4271679.1 thiamine pyrophosphate-requiring protein [Pseudomonas kuykendallii]SDW10790.1 pyruvate dehydrogenase (quinone) [Pseudomonas kuykendallii]
MSKTVGDHLLERLSEWGIERIFGYPGDGINGIMGAMGRHAEDFDYVRVRHEEMSAFMAGAHAKFTGQVGVCLATSGPGAIHLLNGLYDAKLDHMPVLAIVGQQASTSLGSDYQQETDLHTLFKDVSAYVETVVTPAQLRHVLDRALRVAMAEKSVATVIIPNDVQQMPAVESPPHKHANVLSGVGFIEPRPYARDADLQAAADILNAGEKVAILAGAGALGARDELIAVAQALSAGVAKALLGKAALPDDLPWVTGSIGLLGTRASYQLMKECDTLLIVGSTFPYAEFLPREGQARAVQIDLHARNISMRYPIEQALLGDSAETLARLLPLLQPKAHGAWRESVERSVAESWAELEDKAMLDAEPLNPQRVFWEMSAQLPDDAILCGDSGSHTNWYARDVRLRGDMMGSLSGKLASMGSGVPYAIAAKMAHPQRPVIAMVGDGAMQMNGNAELVTVQQYWKRWSNPTFIVLVLNNGDLNQVTWEQRAIGGDPKFAPAQDVIDFPYARYAEMLGFRGIRVDSPEAVADAWREAFAADRPVLIEFVADPNVPPLPPHIEFEQARHFLGALRSDPDRWAMIKQSAKQILK